MGEERTSAAELPREVEVTLGVDDSGRLTVPEDVRDRLGIEANDEIRATLVGSVRRINPKPSSKLETATVDRVGWENTTPTEAGDGLFGPIER